MKTLKNLYSTIILITLLLSVSCENTEVCEEENTGTIALENTRAAGNVDLYINPSRIGSNTPGDISVAPGEKQSIDVPAGVHNVLVRVITSTCVNNRCMIQSTTLDEKSVDVSACEILNMAY